MGSQPISSHDGNWSQLRYLVMRLLEEHEEAIEELQTIVQGSDADGGMCARVQVLSSQLEEVKKRLKEIDTKANSAHKKANEVATKVALVKPDGSVEIMNRKMIAGLLAILTVLSTGLSKLVELVAHLFQSGGGTTP